MGGHGTDHETAISRLHSVQLRYRIEIDEVIEASKPQRHHRNQGLAACDDFGLVTEFAEDLERLVQ
jgi:hypothetical protein